MKFLTIQEIVFFIIIFMFLACSLYSTGYYKYTALSILLLSLFLTAILLIGYKLGNIKDSCQTDQFHFQVTPAKRCDGGAYMTQSGPDHEFCQQLLSTQAGINEYNDFNCGPGFPGRPLPFFEYTPETNDRWESDRCTQGPTPLEVL